MTPFSLWLEEAGAELREENPDKDDEDFNKLAADTFSALPKEEKQVWTTLKMWYRVDLVQKLYAKGFFTIFYFGNLHCV